MGSQSLTSDCVRILSLDSGGPGTYSQALILKEIEDIVTKSLVGDNSSGLICDHFDLIGGVGFGGLLAIMLGRLRMTVAQATDGLLKVAQETFPPDVVEDVNPETRSRRLRESIESIVRERGHSIDAKLYDKAAGMPRCIVVVFAASQDSQQAHALRTYEPRGSSLDPTIVEAACATISIPPLFSPIIVGPPMLRLSFNGGPKDGMNPASKLLDQSKTLFGREREIGALVSIGCGQPSFKPRPMPSDSTRQKQCYETKGSGTFLDVLSPVQMMRDSLSRRKTKRAQLSKDTISTTTVESNAGWHAVNRMADDCADTSKEVLGYFAGSARYMRLNVEKEMVVLNLDDWIGLGIIMGHTKTYLEELQLESDILRLLEVKKRKNLSKSTPKAPPRVSPFFVSRQAPYAIMKKRLVDDPSTNQRIMAITGMGGCGKTQLVSYFLRENDSLFSRLIYVDASSEASVKTDLEAWIQSIKDHEKGDWEDALGYLRHELRDEKWILVFDNADDVKVKLPPFFPDCNHGTILITSRNRNRGDLSNTAHIELGVMNLEEAMSGLLLSAKRHSPLPSGEDVAARSVLAELGYLPLAISLAGSYCRQLSSSAENPYTFEQYLEDFRSERSRLMDHRQVDPLDRYEQSVNTTIALSYGRLSDLEKEYLELFATFDGTDISLELFSEAAKNQFEDRKEWIKRPAEHKETLERLRSLFLTDKKWKPVEVKSAIANLTSNSLLSTTSVAGTIHIHVHPLVQSWTCDRWDQVRLEQYFLMAAQVLTACDDGDDPQLSRAMLPHIQLLETAGKVSGLHINSQMAFVFTLQERGHYETAAEYCGATYEELKGAAGTEESTLLEAARMLAEIRYFQGQYGDALQLQLEVWEKRKEKLGADHPHTLTSASNLASTYGALGRHQDALQLQLEVWEKLKEKLGADHPDTLTSANDLASTYGALGRHQDALQLQLEVLEKRKEKQGADHLHTLNSANNLASTYGELGRHQDALQLQLEVWEKRKEKQGADHPHTLTSASNLASTYGALGRHQDALQLQLEVWEKLKEKLGADHPHTLTSANDLACTYGALGRHQDALQLQLEVWEKLKEKLGADHPHTLTSANNLASTCGELGRHQDALQLQLEVLEKRKEKQGADHLHTLNSANNLASTYGELGRHQDALQLQLEVWEKRKEKQGADHPHALASANNLASTYGELGRHEDVLQLQLEVWEKRKEKQGADHPQTFNSASNLALTYAALGLHQEASHLLLEIWEKQKETLGVDHPHALASVGNLASTYQALGRHQDALEIQLEVWEKQKQRLGVDHPETLTSANNLASTYEALGRHQDALHLQEEVWEKQKKILGVAHPKTLNAGFGLARIYSKQGNKELAFPLFHQILALQTSKFGPGDPNTQSMIEMASECGFSMGDETA